MKELQNFVYRHMDALKHHKRYLAMLTALSMLVTFIVPLILVEPADSMTGILVCNKTVHTHNAECYVGDTLICDIEEHIHTNECYKKVSLLSLKGESSSGTPHADNIDVSNAGGGQNEDGSYTSGNAHEFADGTGWYNPAEVSLYTLLFGELDQEAISANKVHWVEPGASLDANLQKASKEFFLGFASDFCAFIEGDFIAYDADAEGRMFVGGDLIFNGNSEVGEWNYQVGAGDYGHFDPISQTDEYGDLTGFASGIIGGKVYRLGTMGTGASANLNAAPPLTGVLDGKGKRHVNGYDVFLYPEEGAYKRFVVGNLKESLHLDEDYVTMGDGVSKDVPYSTSCNHLYYNSNCAVCSSKTDHDYLGNVNELSQFYIYDDVSTILEKTFDTVRARADNLGQIEAKNVKIIDKKLILDASDIGDAETAYFKIDQWGEINDVEIIVPPNRVLAHDDYYTPGVETISELDLNIIISCEADSVSLKGMTTYVRPSNEELNVEKHQISKRGEDNSTNNHPLSSNIVYNFYKATNVNFTNNCNLNGTILAPNADVTSPQRCPGHLSGAMIAKSFEGGLEFGYRPYRGGVDVLGLSAGYEVPVDKVVAGGANTYLPGAIFAVKEGDKILNLFESSEKTDFAVIPSKVDFTGKTLYQAEKFEQNENANIVEDKDSVNVNNATIKAPLEIIGVFTDAECKTAIDENANVLGKFYIKTNQKVNITQNPQIYCDNNPQVVEAEGEDDDVDYVYTVYLNSPITATKDTITVGATTVATNNSDNSETGSVEINFTPMSVNAGDDKSDVNPNDLKNGEIKSNYTISNFPTGDNIYYQYYVNNERIGESYNDQGYTPNQLDGGEYPLKTAGQFTITAKAYYLDNDTYRHIAETSDTVNVTVKENDPLPNNMSLTFKVDDTEVSEITLGQTFVVCVNGMPSDAKPIYTFNGNNTGSEITPNTVGNYSVNVEVTKEGVTSVLLSKNITVNFPEDIGLTVEPSEYVVGVDNNDDITYTLTNMPENTNVQYYYNDGCIGNSSSYSDNNSYKATYTYNNAKLIGTIPVYAVISSNGLTKNIYFNSADQSNITGKYKEITPSVSAETCEIGKEFKVTIPDLPNGYVANVTFLGETKQAWGDGGTKEVSFYPQTEGTYEVKVTIKYDNNAEKTILQDKWVTVTQRVVDEDAEDYTGTITFGGTFLPGYNITATLNTDATAEEVEWIVYYYYESNTLASGTGTTANFTPQGVGDITYVFRHSVSGKEIARKTAKINAEFSIANKGNGYHEIQLAKIDGQSVGAVLEFRVNDLASNTEKTLSSDYITIDGHLININATSLGNGNFEFYINVRLSGGAETEWNSSFTNSNLVTASALMSLKRAASVFDTNTLIINDDLDSDSGEEYDGIKLIVSDYAKDQYSKDAYVVDVKFYSGDELIGTKKGYTVQSETVKIDESQSQTTNYIDINVADIENADNKPITKFEVIVSEGWLNINSYIPRIRTKGTMATKTSGSGFKLAQNDEKEIELGSWGEELESIILDVYSGGRVKYTLFDSSGAEIADCKDKEVAIDTEGKVKIDGNNLANVSKVKITAINSDLVVNQYSINKYVTQKIEDTTGIINNELTVQNTYTIVEMDPPTGYKKTEDVVSVEVTEVVYLNEVVTNNYLTYPAHVKTTIKAYRDIDNPIFTTEMDVKYDIVNGKVDPYTRKIEIGETEPKTVFTVTTDLENNVTVKVGDNTVVSNVSSIHEFEYDGKKYCFDPSSKMIISVPETHIKFENTKGILFRKVNDNGAAVKDVQIDLFKGDTNVEDLGDDATIKTSWNWVKGTTSECIFEFSDLEKDVIYKFHESNTGGLYERADDIYMVKVDDDTVHYWTADPNNPGDSTKPDNYKVIDSTSSSNIIRMENVPIPGIKPVIAKTKMDGTTIRVGDDEKDAVFSLYAADGTEILSKFVVTGGQVTLDFNQDPHKVYNPRYIENGYLKPGEYYLKEISAPTGYEPAMNNFYFSVVENEDGTYKAMGEKTYEKSNKKITILNAGLKQVTDEMITNNEDILILNIKTTENTNYGNIAYKAIYNGAEKTSGNSEAPGEENHEVKLTAKEMLSKIGVNANDDNLIAEFRKLTEYTIELYNASSFTSTSFIWEEPEAAAAPVTVEADEINTSLMSLNMKQTGIRVLAANANESIRYVLDETTSSDMPYTFAKGSKNSYTFIENSEIENVTRIEIDFTCDNWGVSFKYTVNGVVETIDNFWVAGENTAKLRNIQLDQPSTVKDIVFGDCQPWSGDLVINAIYFYTEKAGPSISSEHSTIAQGDTLEFTFSEADTTVNWSVVNKDASISEPLASITEDGGVLTANGVGVVVVKASDDSGNELATKEITIEEFAISGNTSMSIGGEQTLKTNSIGSVTWSCEDTNVISVNVDSGLVTAIGIGTATVVATNGNYSDTIEITVTPPAPTIKPSGSTLKISNNPISNVMKLKVEKKWAGDRGITEFRKTVTIQLKQRSLINGEYSEWTSYGDPVEVKEANDWQYIWENLPMYVDNENKDGGLYYYTVAEANGADGYTSEVESVEVEENGVKVPLSFNQGGTITVTNTADTVDIPIQKLWSYAGYNKSDVFITNSIKVKLQAKIDGENWTDLPGKTLTLTSKGCTEDDTNKTVTYYGKFKGLPKGYEYRIVEVNTTYGWDDTYPTQEVGVKLDGTLYKMVDNVETECNGFEVKNTFNVDKGSLKLQKLWDGETGTRPYSVMLQLYRSSVAPSYTETDAPYTDENITSGTTYDYKNDYKRLLQHSLYFYDANMCGDDVAENSALAWRTNCHVGDEVPGGYHDAGDHVMFGLPQGYTASMLSWIYLEFFKDNTTNPIDNNDKAHLETILKRFYEFFENSVQYGDDDKITKILVQKGDGDGDHVEWCAPEHQSEDTRIMIWSDQGGDIAAEYSAALSLGYLNFGETKYLQLAEKLYEYAKDKGIYSNTFYPNSSVDDDRQLAAAWLYVAKKKSGVSPDSLTELAGARTAEAGKLEWDGVHLAAAAATAYDTGDWSKVTAWIDSNYIGKDYYYVHSWGTARFNAMAQTATLIAAKHDTTKKDSYLTWVKGQMNQLLGDNDWKDEIVKNSTASSAYGECDNGTIDATGKPICLVTNFVPEGFDVDTPQAAHHRAASGWDTHEEYRLNCGYDEDGYTLIGALVGGPAFELHDPVKQVQMAQYNHDHPTSTHVYIDDLHDYCCNEVAIDYNSGLVGAAAGLYYFEGTGARSTMIEGVEYGSYGLTGTPTSYENYGNESPVDSVITSTPSVATVDVENLETNFKAFAFNPTAISINEDIMNGQKSGVYTIETSYNTEEEIPDDIQNCIYRIEVSVSNGNQYDPNQGKGHLIVNGQRKGTYDGMSADIDLEYDVASNETVSKVKVGEDWDTNPTIVITLYWRIPLILTPSKYYLEQGEEFTVDILNNTDDVTWKIKDSDDTEEKELSEYRFVVDPTGKNWTAGTTANTYTIVGTDTEGKTATFTVQVLGENYKHKNFVIDKKVRRTGKYKFNLMDIPSNAEIQFIKANLSGNMKSDQIVHVIYNGDTEIKSSGKTNCEIYGSGSLQWNTETFADKIPVGQENGYYSFEIWWSDDSTTSVTLSSIDIVYKTDGRELNLIPERSDVRVNEEFDLTINTVGCNITELTAEPSGSVELPETYSDGTYEVKALVPGEVKIRATVDNKLFKIIKLTVKDGIVIDGEEFMDYSDSQVFTVNNTIGNVTWSAENSDGIKVIDDNDHYTITFKTADETTTIATFFKKTGKLVTNNVDAEITLKAIDSYKNSTDTITIQIKERPKVPQLPNEKFLEEVSVIEIKNENNNLWSEEISNLPMYDSKGNPYYYYFEEVAYKLSENDYKPLTTAGGYLINSGNTIYMPYVYYNNGIKPIKEGDPATATVGNKFVSEIQGTLPSTGGSGVTTYYYLGGVIMLLSIAGFTGLKRRERKRRKE